MVRCPGFFHSENQAYEFFGGMRECDIVMLALRPFLGKISGKVGVPEADIFGRVVKGIAQVCVYAFEA